MEARTGLCGKGISGILPLMGIVNGITFLQALGGGGVATSSRKRTCRDFLAGDGVAVSCWSGINAFSRNIFSTSEFSLTQCLRSQCIAKRMSCKSFRKESFGIMMMAWISDGVTFTPKRNSDEKSCELRVARSQSEQIRHPGLNKPQQKCFPESVTRVLATTFLFTLLTKDTRIEEHIQAEGANKLWPLILIQLYRNSSKNKENAERHRVKMSNLDVLKPIR